MKTYEIERYLEISIKVRFIAYPAERQTLEYPGCDAHIEVDEMIIPSRKEIEKMLDTPYEIDQIQQACWEHLRELERPA